MIRLSLGYFHSVTEHVNLVRNAQILFANFQEQMSVPQLGPGRF